MLNDLRPFSAFSGLFYNRRSYLVPRVHLRTTVATYREFIQNPAPHPALEHLISDSDDHNIKGHGVFPELSTG